jgi:hypothetical protein
VSHTHCCYCRPQLRSSHPAEPIQWCSAWRATWQQELMGLFKRHCRRMTCFEVVRPAGALSEGVGASGVWRVMLCHIFAHVSCCSTTAASGGQ